jgi:hypothetical protein
MPQSTSKARGAACCASPGQHFKTKPLGRGVVRARPAPKDIFFQKSAENFRILKMVLK